MPPPFPVNPAISAIPATLATIIPIILAIIVAIPAIRFNHRSHRLISAIQPFTRPAHADLLSFQRAIHLHRMLMTQ